ARTGDREEDRGGARRIDPRVEPRGRGIPGRVRSQGVGECHGRRSGKPVRRRKGLLLGAAVLAACGCRGSATQRPAARSLPKGDAVWLTDPRATSEPGLESRLRRLGASAVLLPAGELVLEKGRPTYRAQP